MGVTVGRPAWLAVPVVLALVALAAHGLALAASVDSAEYVVSAATLTITLDEPAFPVDAGYITLVGGQGGVVAPGGNSVSHSNNTDVIIIDLSGSRGDFEALSHPRSVVIAPGGILSANNSTNGEAVTLAISYDDTAAPGVSSAEYAVSSATLTVALDESVLSPSGMTLTDGTATISVGPGSISHDSSTVAVSLDETARQAFESMSHPRSVEFPAGSLTDMWGNSNGEAVTLAISYDDTAAPGVSSAEYAVSSATLTVALDESVLSPSGMTLTDGTATISVGPGSISHDSSTVAVSLDETARQAFESMSHPRSVEFPAGSLTDMWGNSNGEAVTLAISYDDTAAPGVSSAEYAVSSATLTVALDESVLSPSGMTLTDGTATISVGPGSISHDSSTVAVSLDETARQAFESMSHPRSVEFPAGSLTDMWGNSNGEAVTLAISYDDTAAPGVSSAEYAVSSATLTVALDESVLSPSGMTLTDGTATISVGPGSISHDSSTVAVSLDETARQAFESMSHPRSVEFPAGSLTDMWGNSNGEAVSHTISYDDTTPPYIESATYNISTGTLAVDLSEGALPIDTVMLAGGQASIIVQSVAHAHGADGFEIHLAGDDRTAFEGMPEAGIRLRAGTVYDIWNNHNPDDIAGTISRTGNATGPVTPPDEPEGIVLVPMTAEYDLETRILSVNAPATFRSVDMDRIILHDDSSHLAVSNPARVQNIPFFVIPLSLEDETEFLALDIPRSITVMPGGFTYLADNSTNLANVTATITYGDDTTPPSIAMATYDTTSGDLTVRFNERILSTGADRIRLGNITIDAGDVSHAPNSLTISLSGQVRDKFAATDPPRSITIASGGMVDIAGNSNANDATRTIEYAGDTSPPDVLAVWYDNSTGSLVVTLSEPALVIRADHITLEYNVTSTPPDSVVHTARESSFGIPLNNVADAGLPGSVTISEGGLADIWENSNAAAITVDISRDAQQPAPPTDAPAQPPDDAPIEPPITTATISSATYHIPSGILNVTITEGILMLLEYKIHLGDLGEVPAGSLSYVDNTNSFAVTTAGDYRDDFASLAMPRMVTIVSGGLVDSAGRINIANITGAISYTGDDAPPSILSVRYDNSSNSLAVTLSEPALTPEAGQVRLTYASNATVSPTPVHTAPSDPITLPLDTPPGAPPPLSITFDAGSLSDVWGNSNAAAVTWDVAGDITPPPAQAEPPATPATISSATYNITSGTLTVKMTEDILTLLAGKTHLDDSGDGVSAGSLAYANESDMFAVALASAERDRFVSLTPPRSVTISEGGLVDTQGRINIAEITATIAYVGDDAPPAISSVTYQNTTASLAVTLSEPVLTPDAADISLVYESGTVSAGSINHTSHTSLLTIPAAATANGTLPVSLTVASGGLTDVWGNANAMTLSGNVTYAAPPPPVAAPTILISAVTYNVTSGTLDVTLTEIISSILHGSIHLDNSGTGVSAGSLAHENGTASFAVNLSGDEKSRFVAMPAPRSITISGGGLVDAQGHANAANITGTISYTDNAPPGIQSASYNATSGTLLVRADEPIAMPALDKIRLSGTAGEVTISSTTHDADAFGISLRGATKTAFERLGMPSYVVIMPGGLADIWGNSNTANLTKAVSSPDTAPPTLQSAIYNTTSNALTVSFDEAILVPIADKMQVTGPGSGAITLGPLIRQNDSFTVHLVGKTGLPPLPTRIAISPGGISDIHNNTNTGTIISTIDTAGFGAFGVAGLAQESGSSLFVLTSLTYNTENGNFTLIFAGEVSLTGKVQLRDTRNIITVVISPPIHGSQLDISLGARERADFEDLLNPRSFVIPPNYLTNHTDRLQNNVTLNYDINYTDNAPPAITSAVFDTSDVLNITLSERLASHDSTKIVLSESAKHGTVTFSAGDFAYNKAGYIYATLNPTQKASLLDDPRNVTIMANGITDLWNNANPANATHVISYTGDTAPPAIRSAAYDTASGALNLTMSERLAAYDATKIVLHDSTNLNNVTFSANDFDQFTHGYLNATLNSAQIASFEGLGHSRSVAVLPGGITDSWGNANTAHLTGAISYTGDTAPPAIRSAAYDTASGALNLTMSERLAAYDATKIVLHDSTNLNNVTFSANDFDQFTHGYLNATLNSAQIASFEGLGHPRSVAVLPGGITDSWGNANTAHLTGAISYTGDTAPPAIRSAAYDTASGALNLTMSERLAAYDATKIVLHDSTNLNNVTFSANDFDQFTHGYLNATLNSAQIASFEGLGHPRSVAVLPGGITDSWGNANTAHLTGAISYTGDTAPPAIRSAAYDTASGALNLTMSERLAAYDATKIVLHDSTNLNNVTFSANDFDQFTHGYLNATLNSAQIASFEGLGHPRSVAVLPGGITDSWGNANTAHLTGAISYTGDTAPPAIRSAAYDTASGALNLTMSERLAAYDATKIVLHDSTNLNNVTFSANDFDQFTHGYLNATLNTTQRMAFEGLGHPRSVAVLPGGITDSWGNANTAHLTGAISYTGDTAPPAIRSAAYDTASGALNLTMSERLAAYDATKIVLHDSTNLNNVTFSANDFDQFTHGYLNATLNTTQRMAFEGLGHPRSVAILPNGMADIWGNANTAHLSASISHTDDTPPTMASAVYNITSNTLNVTFSERVTTPLIIYLNSYGEEVSVTSATYGAPTASITIQLAGSDLAEFVNLRVPRIVSIWLGQVGDPWGNTNPADIHHQITYAGDSNVPPSLTSATYDTAADTLTLAMSERLGNYDAAKIILHDSARLNNVTFPAGYFAQHTHGYLNATLNATYQVSFEGLAHPRSVAILPTGITDMWNNTNKAHLSVPISYAGDTAPPGLQSVTYDTAAGLLNLTISERLASFDSTKIVLHDSTKLNNVTFSASDFAQHVHGYLNTTLNTTQRTAFENLAHPRSVAVYPNGLTDMWNNANILHLSVPISYAGDTTPPALSSASYDVISGALNLTMSERLAAYDATKIVLHDSTNLNNVTFSANNFDQFTHGYLNATLNTTQRMALEGLGHPRSVAILPTGMADMWNNINKAHLSVPISYAGDTAPPAIRSAAYDTASGALNLTVSERLAAYDSTKIVLYDSTKLNNVTFSASDFAQHVHGYLNTTLNTTQRTAFENLAHPRSVAVYPNGLTDMWNNANILHLSVPISYAGDTTPPALSSASYDVISGALNLTMSERLAAYDATKIVLHDSTNLNNVTFSANDFDQFTHGYLNATLNSTQVASFEGLAHPRSVAVLPGGITDSWGNANTAHLTGAISYTGDTAPPAIRSAAYDTASGALNLTVSERLAAYDSTKIVLYDSTKLNNVTFSASDFAQHVHGYLNATLNTTQRAAFENLAHPRSVAVYPNGLTDMWNNANILHLSVPISYSDAAPPGIQSATYNVTSGALTVSMNETVSSYDIAKVRLGNMSDTIAIGSLSHDNDTLTIQLNATERDAFKAVSPPRNVTILPGGITDIWGNSNGANRTLAISYVDVTPVSILSATFHTSRSTDADVFDIKLSGPLSKINSSEIVATDGSNAMNLTLSRYVNDTINAKIPLNDWHIFNTFTHPSQLQIRPGGITDVWGNPNTVTLNITLAYTDTIVPRLHTAQYNAETDTISLHFGVGVRLVAPDKITLSAHINNTDTYFAPTNMSASGSIVHISLNAQENKDFLKKVAPRSAIVLVGAVTGTWGEQLASNYTKTISYPNVAPIEIGTALYNVDTQRMTITLERNGTFVHIPTYSLGILINYMWLHDSSSYYNPVYYSWSGSSINPFSLGLYDDPIWYPPGHIYNVRDPFIAMIPPRYFTIVPGGLGSGDGSIFPNAVNITQVVTYTDTTPPVISSAAYSSGNITLAMNERVLVPDVALLRLNGTNGEMTIPNVSHTTHTTTSTIILNATELEKFAALNPPRHVTIMPNGTTDIWDNSNAVNLTRAISYDNAAPPAIKSAVYNVTSHILNVTLDGSALNIVQGMIRLNGTDAEMAVSNMSHMSRDKTFAMRLNSTEHNDFAAIQLPRHITIMPSGITGIWNNTNAHNITGMITYTGTMPQASIKSALYNTTSGLLTVTMNGTISSANATNMRLNDTSGEMSVGGLSHTAHTDAFTVRLSGSAKSQFESMSHPRYITIMPNGVTGIWDNTHAYNLTKAISYTDTTPPSILYGMLYKANDTLAIKLNERILPVPSGTITVNDTATTLAPAGVPSHPSSDSILLKLNGTEQATLYSMLYIRTITVSTMTDIWDNTAINSTINLYQTVKPLPPDSVPPITPEIPTSPTPPIITSASYSVNSGILEVTMNEIVQEPATHAIRLLDDSSEMAVSNVKIGGTRQAEVPINNQFTVTLNATEITSFENLIHPRNVTIMSGGVADSKSTFNPANLTEPITYSDTTPPSIVYGTFYTANDTLAIRLDERILPIPSGTITINDSSTTLAPAGVPSHPSNDSILLKLNGTERDAFDALSYPRTVTITTMTDIWDNTATNSTVTLHYNGTIIPPGFVPPTTQPIPTPPDITSASYDTASGALTVSMNEDILAPVTGKLRLLDNSAEMAVSAISHANSTITITLNQTERASFENLSPPRNFTILAGGVSDLAATPNTANLTVAISYSDTTPPSIVYGTFYTANDTLAIRLDERILPIPSGTITINDSSTTLAPAGVPSHPSNDSILLKLNGTERDAFDALSYPRTVTITTMTDIWDNTATNSTVTLHYNGTIIPPGFVPPTTQPIPTPPDITSASYDTASGALTVSMNEDILAPVTGKLRLLDGSTEVRISAASHINDTITLTLNQTERTSFENLSHPRSVTILPGGVSDLAGSQNTANLTAAISYSDTTPPSIVYGTFYTANGTLAIRLDERILPTQSDNVVINDTSTMLAPAASPSHPSDDSIMLQLNKTERAAFDAMAYPRTVTVQTMTDIWDNTAVNSTMLLTYNNTAIPPGFVPPTSPPTTPSTPTPPTISSASYDTASGVLTVVMDEDTLTPVTNLVRLLDGSAEMAVSSISHVNDTFAVTLTSPERTSFENLSHPRSVTILPGGVSDLAGSQNTANLTAAISYSDTTPPSIVYGTFYTANGTLAIRLDERILPTQSDNVVINDTSTMLAPAASPSHPSDDSIMLQLNKTERAAFDAMAYPRTVTVQTMTDIWDNTAVNSTMLLTYNNTAIPPGFVPPTSPPTTPSTPTPPTISSASYDTASGVLTVVMDEDTLTPVTNLVRLLDGSAEMAVSSISHVNDTFAVTLTSPERTSFENLSHPRSVTILPGGVSDLAATPNTANLTVAISYSDTTPPSIVYGTFYTANGTLAIRLDERILPTQSDNVVINDTSTMLAPAASPSHPSDDSIMLQLNKTERAAFDAMAYPRTVTVQTMTDIWDNTAVNSTMLLTYNNTAIPPGFVPPTSPPTTPSTPTPPTISSASYDTASGVLTVVMDEDTLTPVTNLVRLLDGSAEMAVSSISHVNDTFAVTLTSPERTSFENLSHPRSVTILPGGVSDLAGSQNTANLTAAISYSDTTPPSIVYGTFYTANGTLAIRLDERILPTQSDNVVINDTSTMLAPAASPSHPSDDSIMLQLNKTERAAFDAMAYPRTVTVQTMTDIWDNTAVNSTMLLTYNNTAIPPGFVPPTSPPTTPSTPTPPTISSASYDTASGVLTVVMDEDTLTPVTNLVRLLDGSAEMAVSSISHVNDTFAVTLTSPERTSFENLSHPRSVTILPGGVSDLAATPNTANLTVAISYSDTTPPSIVYGTFYTANGTLAIRLDERILPTQSDNVVINDTSTMLAPAASPSHPSDDSIMLQLNKTERAAFDAMAYPRTVTVQTMTDIWDNTAVNSTMLLTYNNTAIPPGFVPPTSPPTTPSTPTPPTISSASYDTASGVLTVVMDEDTLTPVTNLVRLLDGSAEMAVSSISHVNDTFAVTLTSPERTSFENLSHPRSVTILPGGVSDLAATPNTANLTVAISYSDTTPPSIVYGTFYTANGTLAIRLDERILPTQSDNVVINDTSTMLAPAASPSHPSDDSIMLQLNKTERAAFDAMAYPRTVTVQTMTDIWDNTAVNSTMLLTYNNTAIPPGFVPPPPDSPTPPPQIPGLPPLGPTPDPPMPPRITSAFYNTTSGILTATMNQDVLTPVTGMVRLLDGSAEMAVSAISHASDTFAITLNQAERMKFEDLSHPRNITIMTGGISGIQNNYNVVNLTGAITYSDGLAPSILSAAFYAANDTLDVRLDERILPTPSGNMIINKILFPATPPSHPSNDRILLKLNDTERAAFDELSHPRFASILKLTDIWNNTAINSTALLPYLSTIEPSFDSATYYTGNGSLTVWFTQPLNRTAHDTAKMHVRDTNQTSGGITLSNSMIVDNGTYAITFDMDRNDTDTVNSMATPELDIDSGAVRDPAGNLISAAADRPITVVDTIPPSFKYAVHHIGDGTLVVEFDEHLDPNAFYMSQIHIRDINHTTGGVTLSNEIMVPNGAPAGGASGASAVNITFMTFYLNNSDNRVVGDMDKPELDIDYAAVSDLSGNPITRSHDRPIDLIYPYASFVFGVPALPGSAQSGDACLLLADRAGPYGQLMDASYDRRLSVMTLVFDLAVNASTVNLAGLSVSSNLTEYIHTHDTTALDDPVLLTERDSRYLHVLLPGGLPENSTTYIVVNGTAVRESGSVSFMHPGVLPLREAAAQIPLPESAYALPDHSRLYVSFSEPIIDSETDAAQFHIRDAGQDGPAVTLDVADIILTGSPSLVLFDTARHAEVLRDMESPVLDVGMGATLGAAGASSMDATAIPVVPPGPYQNMLEGPATYNTITGTLWLDVAATDIIVRPELITLHNGTDSVSLYASLPLSYTMLSWSLHNGTDSVSPDTPHAPHQDQPGAGLHNGTDSVSPDTATMFVPSGHMRVAESAGMVYMHLSQRVNLTGNIYLSMEEGAILHESGWTQTMPDVPVSVFSGIAPVWSGAIPLDGFGISDKALDASHPPSADISIVQSGGRTLAAVVLKNDTGRLGILDATDPGRMTPLSYMQFDHAVDLDTVSVDGVPYAMALNRTSIHAINLMDPASPTRAATIPYNSTYGGAIAATVRDGVPYLSYANFELWDLLDMSVPSNPQTVYTAGLASTVDEYGAEWSGGTLLGSFNQMCLHVLDTENIRVPTFRPLNTTDQQAMVIIGDTPLIGIATAGPEPGLTIADMTPENFGMVSFTPTNGTLDIGALNLYGIPYILLTTPPNENNTSYLLVFDALNATAPILAHTVEMAGEVRLDTAIIDGAAHVLLLDSAGAVQAIRLDTGGPVR